jgi:hypothetical protein
VDLIDSGFEGVGRPWLGGLCEDNYHDHDEEQQDKE